MRAFAPAAEVAAAVELSMVDSCCWHSVRGEGTHYWTSTACVCCGQKAPSVGRRAGRNPPRHPRDRM